MKMGKEVELLIFVLRIFQYRHLFDFSRGQVDWTPILLLVPLILGPDKINRRYLPLLSATFAFPQSLGLLGGRPGASTYIVGFQDEKAFYLDPQIPHEVQQEHAIPLVETSQYNLTENGS